jgi:hypothetical protein
MQIDGNCADIPHVPHIPFVSLPNFVSFERLNRFQIVELAWISRGLPGSTFQVGLLMSIR